MNPNPPIFLFVPGINNWGAVFGDFRDWPVEAPVYVNSNPACLFHGVRSQSFMYMTTALTVSFMQKYRSESLSRLIAAYSRLGYPIHLFGHSNGTRVILDALRYGSWPSVQSLHLICGACDGDWQSNGLNAAMMTGRVKRCFVYMAGKDGAMHVENTLLGKLLFGIGLKDKPLGLTGPANVVMSLREQMKRDTIVWPNYDHSTCWEPIYFKSTMAELVADALA